MTAETIAALERELEALKSDLEQARRGAAEATRYRAILDGCEDVISVLDSEGRCDFVSEIFATRTGLEVARMVGGGGLTFIHPEDRRGAQAVLVDMVARGPGARARLEYRRIRAGGGWAHVEAIARNLLDDPDIRGIVTVGREIDEAVRLRQELREAQDRYEHALRISREAIWERDLVQGTIFLSPRMLEELGYLPGDVPPGLDVLRDLVHEDDRPDADAASTAHLATGARYEVEVRLRLKSGDYRWFRVVGEALRGYDGRALRMLGQISDVHDRKLAEVQLRNSERMFRSLFESTSVAVTLRDVTAQRFVDCNDAALRLYRARSREDLIHKSPVDLAPKTQPDGRPSLEVAREHIGRALRDGFHHFEWEAMRLDGEVFPSALRITVIDLPDGRRLMQTMIEDVTERKRAERAARQAELALAKAKEDAVAASAMKSAFLANMSHELRTPLNGVIGMIELLAATGLDDRQRHYAEIARTSARLLLSVINDVLDFSKIEAGKLELEAIEFSLPEILEEVRANMAHAAEAKGLALACDVTPALAAPLVGDPARLRQVLLNLVNNAVKFTRVGAVTVRASAVSDAGRAVRLRVEVKDTGIGIVPEAQAKLFQPFTQVDASTTRVHGGSGLGLAICRQLIERMDGVIGVTSA
ncbi:MAG TPA: PAS domain S-box protein, partial [Polyangiaceae bacterium]